VHAKFISQSRIRYRTDWPIQAAVIEKVSFSSTCFDLVSACDTLKVSITGFFE